MEKLIYSLFIFILICSCSKNNEVLIVDTSKPVDTIYVSEDLINPTITKGYYGILQRWVGDFMPGNDNPGTITPVNNEIYIYEKLVLNDLLVDRVKNDDWNFYYLDSIDYNPSYIINPNSYGFYQIELDTGSYSYLIKLQDNLLFVNEFQMPPLFQIGPFNLEADSLINKNLDIDFEKQS